MGWHLQELKIYLNHCPELVDHYSLLHGRGDHGVALLSQRWGQKLELAGKVLVDK